MIIKVEIQWFFLLYEYGDLYVFVFPSNNAYIALEILISSGVCVIFSF